MPQMPADLKRMVVDEAGLRELLKGQMEWVAKCLTNSPSDSWMPMLSVLCKEGPDDKGTMMLFALAVGFNEADEKRQVLRKIGKDIFAERKIPVAAVLTCEAWASTQRPGAPRMEPRHDPNRREVVSASGLTLGTKVSAMATMEVSRSAENLIVPGAFGEICTKGECPILQHLYAGFADSARASYLGSRN